MAYSRREVKDGVTVMNKDLYDNLQDGIDTLIEEVTRLGGDITEPNAVVNATVISKS